MIEGKSWKGITIKGFRDSYTFDTTAKEATVRTAIIAFFMSRQVHIVVDQERIIFQRGRKIWCYFGIGPESLPFQTIQISLSKKDDDHLVIHVEYDVKGWLIRFPPYQLRAEVELMEKTLNTIQFAPTNGCCLAVRGPVES